MNAAEIAFTRYLVRSAARAEVTEAHAAHEAQAAYGLTAGRAEELIAELVDARLVRPTIIDARPIGLGCLPALVA